MSSGEEISPTEISMEFISKDLLKRASEHLITMRQQGFLCDVTLLAHRQAADSTESELALTEEAVGIRAHRVVLACSCPYFNAMFKSKMTETVKSSIFMHCVDADILEALVDFMYTGKITVTQKNVQDLLPAADLLQMTEVRNACCNFLERQMSVTNCLALKMFAEVHSCSELGSFAGAYIEKYFREVMETEDFCRISFEYLEELLSSDSLQVDKEDQVFDALIRWINYDVAGRSKYLYSLLENVRLSFVSPFCLIEDIVPNPLIRSSLLCSNHMVDALSALFLKINFPSDCDSYPTRPRICYLSGGSDARGLMVIGGQSPKAIREVDFLDFHTSSWTSLKELPMRRCRFGVANVDGDIYAVGGFNGGIRVRTVELFKFPINTWVSAPLLQSRRSTLGVAEVGGRIYAVGGFDGSTGLMTAEAYDPRCSQWQFIAQMSTKRSSVGVAVLNGLLYAVGGYDGGSHQCLHTVECYEPRMNCWTRVANMRRRRSGPGVVVADGLLYVLGGHDGPEVHNSVEVFDYASNQWSDVADMISRRRNVGACARGDVVYAIGGDDGYSNLNSIEVFDPKESYWKTFTPSMPIGRSYAGVTLVMNDRPSTQSANLFSFSRDGISGMSIHPV